MGRSSFLAGFDAILSQDGSHRFPAYLDPLLFIKSLCEMNIIPAFESLLMKFTDEFLHLPGDLAIAWLTTITVCQPQGTFLFNPFDQSPEVSFANAQDTSGCLCSYQSRYILA